MDTSVVRLLRANLDGRLDHMPADELLPALAGWELRVLPCEVVLMVKGNEVHVAAPPESRGIWLSRRVLREQLTPLLKEFGSIVTTVAGDNPSGHAFVQRLGFHRVSCGKYELKELKHA